MLVQKVQSLEILPQKWESCLKLEHSWRCCDDLDSFTELLESYCNAYFGLRVPQIFMDKSSCRALFLKMEDDEDDITVMKHDFVQVLYEL